MVPFIDNCLIISKGSERLHCLFLGHIPLAQFTERVFAVPVKLVAEIFDMHPLDSAAMHSGQLESDLPTGWHVHLIILGPGTQR